MLNSSIDDTWPELGQEFNIYCATIAYDNYLVHYGVGIPYLVSNVLDPVSGSMITDELFLGNLPDKPGLYLLKVQYYHTSIDGWYQEEYGFEILSTTSV